MVLRSVRVRFTDGKLEPLDELDLEEGAEVEVTLEDGRSPGTDAPSLLAMFEELHESVPLRGQEGLPPDGAKHYRRYLYGVPEDRRR